MLRHYGYSAVGCASTRFGSNTNMDGDKLAMMFGCLAICIRSVIDSRDLLDALFGEVVLHISTSSAPRMKKWRQQTLPIQARRLALAVSSGDIVGVVVVTGRL